MVIAFLGKLFYVLWTDLAKLDISILFFFSFRPKFKKINDGN